MSTNKLYAIAHFANDYHSGQWSRGYRLLCMAHKLLIRKGLSSSLSNKSFIYSGKHPSSKIYETLVKNHSEKI
jgi:hypothetical protein